MHIYLSYSIRTYLNIHILLGRCLKELNTQLIGQLTTALEAYDALVLHVAFVAHQYDLSVVPRVRLDLCYPKKKQKTNGISITNH